MNASKLSRLLVELQKMQDEALRKEWDRSLPFSDGLFDRWERAKRLGFGDRASVYDSCLIFGDVRVGNDTWIGPFVVLDASGGGVAIGSGCSISAGVHIYTHDTAHWAVSGGAMAKRTGPVVIGDWSYVGPQSVIGAGVTIGRQTVIGANSFVNRDVEDRSVVVGSPARVVGEVVGDGSEVALRYFEH